MFFRLIKGFGAVVLLSTVMVATAVGCSDDTQGDEASNDADNGESDAGETADTDDSSDDADAGDAAININPRWVSGRSRMRQVTFMDDERAIATSSLDIPDEETISLEQAHVFTLLDTSQPERLRLIDFHVTEGSPSGGRVGDRFVGTIDRQRTSDVDPKLTLVTVDIVDDKLEVSESDSLSQDECNWTKQIPEPRDDTHTVHCGLTKSARPIQWEDDEPYFGREIDVSDAVADQGLDIWEVGGFEKFGLTDDGYGIQVIRDLYIWDLFPGDGEEVRGSKLALSGNPQGFAYDASADRVYIVGEYDDSSERPFVVVDVSDRESPEIIQRWDIVDDLGFDADTHEKIRFRGPELTSEGLVMWCARGQWKEGLCHIRVNEEGDPPDSYQYTPGDELASPPPQDVGPFPTYHQGRVYFADMTSSDTPDYLEHPEVGIMSVPLDDLLD